MYIEISHNKKTFARCLFISVKVSIAVFEYFNICFKRAISRWNCEIFIFSFQNFNRDDSDCIFEFVSINSKIKLKKIWKKIENIFLDRNGFLFFSSYDRFCFKVLKKIALKKREFFNCCHNKVTIIFYSKNLSITWILDWVLKSVIGNPVALSEFWIFKWWWRQSDQYRKSCNLIHRKVMATNITSQCEGPDNAKRKSIWISLRRQKHWRSV